METSICSTVEWTNENSKIKDIKVQECFKETPLNIKSYKDYQSALYTFYNDLCMYEVEKSVDAFLNIHPEFVKDATSLQIFMKHTAVSIQIMLGSPVARMPGNTSSRYPGYINTKLEKVSHKDINEIIKPSNPDAPAFIEYISSKLDDIQENVNIRSQTMTQIQEQKRSERINHPNRSRLKDDNGLRYKRNKIWIIACLAYLQFLKDKNSNTQNSHLMYIFASTAWRVFNIMTNRFEDDVFKNEIIHVLNSEDGGIMEKMRRDIVMIKTAEFALANETIIGAINTSEEKNFENNENVQDFYKEMNNYLNNGIIKRVETSRNGGYKKTGERAFIKGRNRVVYTRLRGGKARYIKSKHGFENIKT